MQLLLFTCNRITGDSHKDTAAAAAAAAATATAAAVAAATAAATAAAAVSALLCYQHTPAQSLCHTLTHNPLSPTH